MYQLLLTFACPAKIHLEDMAEFHGPCSLSCVYNDSEVLLLQDQNHQYVG